ncbi:MAG: hypothetical protein HFI31_12040 [Lachnospiraceae bacterium]|nr:hypothetical protein [Lachnospiraceae bacterium]MCI9134897.1 hypothetical protein [Lachnospiraceae bacterium]
MRKYSYTILLAVSFLVMLAGWQTGSLPLEGNREWTPFGLKGNTGLEEGGALAGLDLMKASVVPRTETPVQEPQGKTEEIKGPAFYKADLSYFRDALFIGDSRTVGLSEYGDLGEAEVFAGSGMNLYVIYKKEIPVTSGEKKKLEEVLAERQFGKIYLMLGINELGYAYEQTLARYEELLEKMRQLQPHAVFFLEANLHIAKRKSQSSEVYNNESIDRFNSAVEKLADGKTSIYIDVNEIFDDREGNLDQKYTADDAHVLGKYYEDWVEWILTKAVPVPERVDGEHEVVSAPGSTPEWEK